MLRHSLICVMLLLCAAVSASAQDKSASPSSAPPAADPAFAGQAKLTKTDTGYDITFALARSGDVTVRVIDAQGNVVRHLVSGMVGLEKAAEPLKPAALTQTVCWDGTDDAGKPLPVGDYTVRIGLGLKAKFDKFILWNPNGFGKFYPPNWAQPGAMAVGPKGQLYIIQQYGVHYSSLRVLDRDGRFVRMLWPLSMDHELDVLNPFLDSTRTIWPQDVAAWRSSDWSGRTVPRAVSHSAFYWYGLRSFGMAVTKAGRIFVLDGHVTSPTQILTISPAGLPGADNPRIPWSGGKRRGKDLNIAAGPDGDVYVSDRGSGIVAHLDGKTLQPVNSFTYDGENKLAKPTYLIGPPTGGGAGVWDPLWAVAVDKEGRIWLAHVRDKAVKIFGKDGKLLGSFDTITVAGREEKIDVGQMDIGANWASGAVYLNINTTKGRKLIKLTGPDSRTAAAVLDLPPRAMRVAVDGQANLVWVMCGESVLVRAQDSGEKFEATTIDGLAGNTLTFPRLLKVDNHGRLYVTDATSSYIQTDVDGKNFKRLKLRVGGHGYCAIDSEDNWYIPIATSRTGREVWKLSPAGKRLKIGAADAITLENCKEPKGIWIGPGGDIYVAMTAPTDFKSATFKTAYGGTDLKGEQFNYSRVDVFSPDGKLKTKDLVKVQGINDVALDRRGNVYVIEAGTCHGAHKRRAAKLDNRHKGLLNKLMKFAPGGGARDQAGHLWTYRGLSGVSTFSCAGECPAGQLHVDADDRIWVVDSDVYGVAAIDSAGNLIARIGAYGNEDCRGGGGDEMIPASQIVRDPEVPLARPFGVAVWKDYLLISDMYTHRVVRCKLAFAAQQELPVQVK